MSSPPGSLAETSCMGEAATVWTEAELSEEGWSRRTPLVPALMPGSIDSGVVDGMPRAQCWLMAANCGDGRHVSR